MQQNNIQTGIRQRIGVQCTWAYIVIPLSSVKPSWIENKNTYAPKDLGKKQVIHFVNVKMMDIRLGWDRV